MVNVVVFSVSMAHSHFFKGVKYLYIAMQQISSDGFVLKLFAVYISNAEF